MKRYLVLLLAAVVISCEGSSSDSCNVCPESLESIQAAIDAAVDGDTIVVPAGTYVEHIAIEDKDIVLIGDTVSQGVVLQQSCSCEPIVSFTDIAGRSTQIVGFIIEGATGVPGVSCRDASPTIRKCTIRDNDGGGIRLNGSGLALIVGNEIYRNGDRLAVGATAPGSAAAPDCRPSGPESASPLYLSGGGIAMIGAAADIIDNIIDSNRAGLGGAIYGDGEEEHVIEGNLIRGNYASSGGGGIYLYEGSPITITGNLFIRDTSNFGGGIDNSGRDGATVIGNTFDACVAGIADGAGNAIWWARHADVGCVIRNNIVTNTITAAAWGGAIGGDNEVVGTVALDYNAFWNNQLGGCHGFAPGLHSLEADPLYCDPVAGDYHLDAASPCVGTGEGGVDRGAFPVGCSAAIQTASATSPPHLTDVR